MAEIAPQDSRNYFVLPQASEGAAHYTDGTPGRGAGQHAPAKGSTMKFRLSAYAPLLAFFSVFVYAGDWSSSYRPAAVRYVIYGNSLGDSAPPSSDDRKIAFEVTGRSAREIFDAIGPDLKDSCSSEPEIRFRSRDEERVSCIKTVKGDYTCHFGFDLKSGKSIGGSIC